MVSKEVEALVLTPRRAVTPLTLGGHGADAGPVSLSVLRTLSHIEALSLGGGSGMKGRGRRQRRNRSSPSQAPWRGSWVAAPRFPKTPCSLTSGWSPWFVRRACTTIRSIGERGPNQNLRSAELPSARNSMRAFASGARSSSGISITGLQMPEITRCVGR